MPRRGVQDASRGALDHHNLGSARLMLGLVLIVSNVIGLVACGPTSEEPTVVAVVNNKPITEDELEYRWKELPQSTQARYRKEGGKRKFLDDLIMREILLQEAHRRGLDESPATREQLARLKEQVLLDELMRQVTAQTGQAAGAPAGPIGDISSKDLEAYYMAHGASALLATEQLRLAHILVGTVEEGQEIKRQLDQGADFGRLAEKHSVDAMTRHRSGDLGTYRKGIMDKVAVEPEIEPVLLSLKPGTVSEPIKTVTGVHLVKVISRQVVDREGANAVRQRLLQEFRAEKSRQRFQEFVSKLKATASVRIADASRLVVEDSSLPHTNP
jgi:peptidyl-prolyl cis-trans isomerase C